MAKGLLYEGPNDPRLPSSARSRWEREAAATGKTAEEIATEILERHNERWRIVEECPVCALGLIAGERENHIVSKHVSGRARSAVRTLLELPDAVRTEVFGLFEESSPLAIHR